MAGYKGYTTRDPRPKDNIPEFVRGRIASLASDLEKEMIREGFKIGKKEKYILDRFWHNGIYPTYIGHKTGEEYSDVCAQLKICYPTICVKFFYLLKGEIVGGISSLRSINLSASTPSIEEVRKAVKLYDRVVNWLEVNKKSNLSLDLSRRLDFIISAVILESLK